MNKRILQLANIWANRRAEDEKLGIVYTFSEPALEQFAELIIKDCIEAIQNESMNSDDDWERGLRIAEGAIEKHFGVKE